MFNKQTGRNLKISIVDYAIPYCFYIGFTLYITEKLKHDCPKAHD